MDQMDQRRLENRNLRRAFNNDYGQIDIIRNGNLGFLIQTKYIDELRSKYSSVGLTDYRTIEQFQQSEHGKTIGLYYKKLELSKNEYDEFIEDKLATDDDIHYQEYINNLRVLMEANTHMNIYDNPTFFLDQLDVGIGEIMFFLTNRPPNDQIIEFLNGFYGDDPVGSILWGLGIVKNNIILDHNLLRDLRYRKLCILSISDIQFHLNLIEIAWENLQELNHNDRAIMKNFLIEASYEVNALQYIRPQEVPGSRDQDITSFNDSVKDIFTKCETVHFFNCPFCRDQITSIHGSYQDGRCMNNNCNSIFEEKLCNREVNRGIPGGKVNLQRREELELEDGNGPTLLLISRMGPGLGRLPIFLRSNQYTLSFQRIQIDLWQSIIRVNSNLINTEGYINAGTFAQNGNEGERLAEEYLTRIDNILLSNSVPAIKNNIIDYLRERTQGNSQMLGNLRNAKRENLTYQNSLNMYTFLNRFERKNFRQMITGYFKNKLYVRNNQNYTCFYSIPDDEVIRDDEAHGFIVGNLDDNNEGANGFVVGNLDDNNEGANGFVIGNLDNNDNNDNNNNNNNNDNNDDNDDNDDDDDDDDNNDNHRMNIISNTCHTSGSSVGSVIETGINSSSIERLTKKRKLDDIVDDINDISLNITDDISLIIEENEEEEEEEEVEHIAKKQKYNNSNNKKL